MPNTEEQRLDLIENCTLLLEGPLKPFSQTDNTAKGAWSRSASGFKERAENHDLPLQAKEGKLGSLLYIYTNGELFTAKTTKEEIYRVEMIMDRIISLADEGQLLMKPLYSPYALRSMEPHPLLMALSLIFYPRLITIYKSGNFVAFERECIGLVR